MDSAAGNPRVLIATPVYDDNVTTVYATSVQKLVAHLLGRVELHSHFISSAMVHTARSAFASTVIEDERYSHLLFIDSDMGFRPEAVERMIEFDKPVVGVVTPQRGLDLKLFHSVARREADPDAALAIAQRYVSANLLKTEMPDGRTAIAVRDGFARATRAGTGLMLIKRSTLLQMRVAFPELVAPADERYRRMGVRESVFQVFEPSIQAESGVFLSEDMSFCHRWVSGCGGEIWSCIDEVITHAGGMQFSGRYADHLRLAATQAASA